jgi:hypothetical protein
MRAGGGEYCAGVAEGDDVEVEGKIVGLISTIIACVLWVPIFMFIFDKGELLRPGDPPW